MKKRKAVLVAVGNTERALAKNALDAKREEKRKQQQSFKGQKLNDEE